MDLLFIRDILVLIVTLGFGVYFSYTDISRRIIPNYPLVGYLVFGLVINILFIVSEPALTKNILSALGLTLAISFGVYYFNIWHAGDSKLYLATTFNIIPFAVKPLSMALLNFCLPLAVCYVLMFPWLLARAMVSKRRHSRNPLWFVIKKATRSVLSLERPLQVRGERQERKAVGEEDRERGRRRSEPGGDSPQAGGRQGRQNQPRREDARHDAQLWVIRLGYHPSDRKRDLESKHRRQK